MQFLITMTTRVPDGVTEADVDEVRGREAVRSRELNEGGHLLRLWRPPLAPGEWRTFGLFEAEDADQIETLLASMPLRIWRTDDVTTLGAHPNDPASPPAIRPEWSEYFTIFTIMPPDEDDREEYDEAVVAEARSSSRLAEVGNLVRLWRLDNSQSLGLWQTADHDELGAILTALPMGPWLEIDTVPLSAHPSDPARTTPAPAA